MTQSHPVAERYLARLTDALTTLEPAERQEVVQEIRDHIAEATARGQSMDEVLQALGSADTLAKAYSVELLMHPRGGRRRRTLEAALRVIGVVAIGSIPTIVVVAGLGSLGVAFVASGMAIFVAGVWALVAPLPHFVTLDVHPLWPVLMGPPMVMVGLVALRGVWLYVRFLARAIRSALPRSASAAA